MTGLLNARMWVKSVQVSVNKTTSEKSTLLSSNKAQPKDRCLGPMKKILQEIYNHSLKY